jgi:inward rectifier potassium channel
MAISPGTAASTVRRRSIAYRSDVAPTIARVRAHGQARRFAGDAYFVLLTTPFWRFCLIVAGLVLAINAVFAWLYTLDPGGISNARPGSFEDAFFFSVQTLATIGYGAMAPQTRYAHVVVTIEAILGIVAVGSLAGISFARFARATARVLFSQKLVIRRRNGTPHLQLRVANWRTNLIIEASVRIYVLVAERTTEGEVIRVPVELKLVRNHSPVFFLTWTVMHRIDEHSPLFHEDSLASLQASGAQLFAMLTGYDQTLGQSVHAHHEYKFSDIVHSARFVDIVEAGPDGVRAIDFTRFHDIEPIEEERQTPAETTDAIAADEPRRETA